MDKLVSTKSRRSKNKRNQQVAILMLSSKVRSDLAVSAEPQVQHCAEQVVPTSVAMVPACLNM